MDKIQAFKIMDNKQSQLCIGFDLTGTPEDNLSTALEIIDTTYDLVAAYKPNRQYWLGNSLENLKELTDRIHRHNSFAIIDHKLSDIGSTNEAALIHSKLEGFDFITISPFPGNLEASYRIARELDLGLIALVMMSNKEAIWMKSSGSYKMWAEQSSKFADGIVIGTTNHVDEKLLKEIYEIIPDTLVLAPGLGKQGGNVGYLKEIYGNNVLFNVSRGISLSDDYRLAAENFNEEIKRT